MPRVLAVLLPGLIVTSPAAPTRAADWPQWRGPHRDGISRETGLLDKWPATGPKLLWEARGVGPGFSTVSIVKGRVFTQGNRGAESRIIALDLETGKEVWSAPNGDAYENSYGDGPRGTPTVDGDLLYAIGAHGDLASVETASGKVRWAANILEKFGADNIGWGISESPLIVGDRLIVTPGGRDATIVALDKKTGETLWTSKGLSDGAGYSSAITFGAAGVEQVVNFTGEGVVGVALEDGRFLWRYDRVANGIANIATPVFVNGAVFATSFYDTGCALIRLEKDGERGVAAKEVYFQRSLKNHHGGVIVVEGHVYGCDNASWTCLEVGTGKRKWVNRGVGKGSLVHADGRFYLLGEDGVVGLIEANPSAYREISRFEIDHGGQPAWAHPVVSGGRLFIRTEDRVRCFDVAAGGPKPGN
jgi:outer membrane protein assembly factor BamB